MFKLFDRYILKEIISPFAIGLIAYTFVLLMNQILDMSELFIERDVPLQVVLVLLIYLIPAMMAFSLPMSVLLGFPVTYLPRARPKAGGLPGSYIAAQW